MGDAVTQWVLSAAVGASSVGDLLPGLAAAFASEGLAIDRLWYACLLLHPQRAAQSHTWVAEGGLVDSAFLPLPQAGDLPALSPANELRDGSSSYRIRLTGTEPMAYPPLEILRAAGYTDYFMVAIGQDPRAVVSIQTREPGGFDDARLAVLTNAVPALTLAAACIERTALSRTLLHTYLGRRTGDEVLDGRIRRGDGVTIHAAILFTDLRGFTTLADRTPLPELLELLNDWLGLAATAIENEGGEVLKFVGDGLLAIVQGDRDPAAAARAALRAARSLVERLAERHRDLSAGVGLHVGEVLYGNIGSDDRLDFTVIGPAVNLASRLEGLCRQLGRPILMSAEFAAACGDDSEALGARPVKGLDAPVEVFAPPPASATA